MKGDTSDLISELLPKGQAPLCTSVSNPSSPAYALSYIITKDARECRNFRRFSIPQGDRALGTGWGHR